MSEHFRKDAPHYEFSTVRIRLDEWLEDRSSGTLFGPKGCGKSRRNDPPTTPPDGCAP